MSTKDAVLAIFKRGDWNGDGVLNRAELKAVLQRLDGKAWDNDGLESVFEAADLNHDDVVSYEEFINWVFQEGDLQKAIFATAELIAMPIEDEIASALTWARTKPLEVAQLLRGRLEHYKGRDYFPPERSGSSIVTKEGVAVVKEAIAFVEALEPMGGVGATSELGLAVAGEDHVVDIGQVGTASHTSSDGTTAADRVGRYGKFETFGECLWYGSEKSDARMMVLDLIVDDGVESRGHRKGIYNPRYDAVGVAYGPHTTFGSVAAMEFAKAWRPKSDAIQARVTSGPIKIDAAIAEKAKAAVETHWKLGRCAVCKEPIKGGRVVDVEQAGGKMHADCFKCISCGKQLSGTPFKVHGDSLYCSPCHSEKHGVVCAKCEKPIAGGMSKCALGSFHIECVVCSKCDKAIGKTKFSTAGGVMTCQSCSSAAPKAKTKSKAKAKPKSMSAAGKMAAGIGMDYAALE